MRRLRSPRVLFVAAAVLLVAGLVSAVVTGGDEPRPGQTVVAGDGGHSVLFEEDLGPTTTASSVEVTSTTAASAAAATSARTGSATAAVSAAPSTTGRLQGSGLYVVAPDASGLRRLTAGVVHFPTWSPDGGRIAFVRDSRLHVIQPDGGNPQALATPGPVNHPLAWSPDGGRVAFISGDKLYVMAPGGAATEVASGAGLRWVAWSPNGARFAVLEQHHLDILDADGSDRRRIFSRAGWDAGAVWAPDNVRLALHDWDQGPVVIDVDSAAVFALTTPRNLGWRPSWSPTGGEVAYAHSTPSSSDLAVGKADGSGTRTVTAGAVSPAWSPDGSRIAFMTYRNPGGTGRLVTELSVIGADGSGERRLTSNGRTGAADAPTWSPDSRTIAFAYNAG